ncbi:MAG: DUF5522 domain-containing protein [Arenicella sp.]|nr:DUF5522 domain-containing protein [Arenicella sp.]HAU68004.1 hypothetical protein [Gammaproteobacteria bacterium]
MKKTDPTELGSKTTELTPSAARKWPLAELVENKHYYMEHGFMVFTEEYHLCRGRCCGNACRHCPFEHVNVRR